MKVFVIGATGVLGREAVPQLQAAGHEVGVLDRRTTSMFENSPLKATGAPSPEERAVLDQFRGKVPEAVFGPAILPPVSDGSGSDRALLQAALLSPAGCQERARLGSEARDILERQLQPPAASLALLEQL